MFGRGRRSDRITLGEPLGRAPRESPRHFAASMDESVIVGYYTSAEVPFQSYLSANPKERKEKYGKK